MVKLEITIMLVYFRTGNTGEVEEYNSKLKCEI